MCMRPACKAGQNIRIQSHRKTLIMRSGLDTALPCAKWGKNCLWMKLIGCDSGTHILIDVAGEASGAPT